VSSVRWRVLHTVVMCEPKRLGDEKMTCQETVPLQLLLRSSRPTAGAKAWRRGKKVFTSSVWRSSKLASHIGIHPELLNAVQ
jgi:hypothetical protein